MHPSEKLKKNYLFQENVITHQPVLELLPRIDTLVFDIDGVLIDVRNSYRNAICKTVQYYFKEILKFKGSQQLILPEETKYFKMAGGFNNDWDLTSAVILFYLWKSAADKSDNVDILRYKTPEIQIYCTKILIPGGGLKKNIELIQQKSEQLKEKIFSLWNRKLIIKLFKEIYAGKNCFNMYGFHPSIVESVGLIRNERNIFSEKQKVFLEKFSIGVLTGRTNREAEFALNGLGWNDLLSKKQVMTANDVAGKPDPEGLMKLSAHLNTKLGLYIGDIPDDLQTGKNFNNESKGTRFLSAIVLGEKFDFGNKMVDFYLNAEVDLLAKDVNGILKWVKKNRNKKFDE